MPVMLWPPTLAVPKMASGRFFRRREARRSMIATTIRVLDTADQSLVDLAAEKAFARIAASGAFLSYPTWNLQRNDLKLGTQQLENWELN